MLRTRDTEYKGVDLWKKSKWKVKAGWKVRIGFKGKGNVAQQKTWEMYMEREEEMMEKNTHKKSQKRSEAADEELEVEVVENKLEIGNEEVRVK